MRKKLLFIFFIILSVTSKSQDFQLQDELGNIVNGDTITFYEHYNSNASSNVFTKDKFLKFYNNTGTTMVMELSRSEVKIIPGSEDYYCYGQQCLAPVLAGTNPFRTSDDTLRVDANSFGQGSAPFAVYLDQAQGDTAIYDYTFTDKLNVNNRATVSIRWIVVDNSANGPNFQIRDTSGNVINGDTLTFNELYEGGTNFNESFSRSNFINFYNSTSKKQEMTLFRAERQIIDKSFDSYCFASICTSPILAGSESFKTADGSIEILPLTSTTGDSTFVVGLDTAKSGTAIYSYTFTDAVSKNNSATIFVRWVVVDVTSIEENDFSSKFSIFPNPAETVARVSFENAMNYNQQEIQLYNILGEQVLTQVLSKGTTATEVDVEDLTNGIYFMNIVVNGTRVGSRKMIVK